MTALKCIIWCAVSSRAQNEPDKISLPRQEEDACKMAEKEGWKVIDILRVPGHSRRYIDFHKLSADARQRGIDAFQRLDQHWLARDFDVLVVLDGNRFARTQALHAYVVERTINSGARIYSLMDGWISQQNYRMWIAMNGYKSAGEIDRFVQEREKAMDARAQRGLPITSRIPISHVEIRDPKSGKSIGMEVNEEKRRLWDDLAELIIEGVGWDNIERELYERFGHVNEEGKPYYATYMYRLVMKPTFWGHTARHFNNAGAKNGYKKGPWVYREGEAIPDGAVMYRNTHEPVYKGKTAERVMDELDRRTLYIRGKASSSNTHPFTGLAICGKCGSFMAMWSDENYSGLYCPASKGSNKLPKCDNKGVRTERYFIKRVNAFLEQMLLENTTEVFQNIQPEKSNLAERICMLEQEIAEVESQVRLAIRKQLTAGEEIQSIYDEELDKLNKQLKNMKEALQRMKGELPAVSTSTSRQQATLEELAQLTLKKFWSQESRKINQMLHRIFGKRRLVILDKEIIGVVEVHRRQRRHS